MKNSDVTIVLGEQLAADTPGVDPALRGGHACGLFQAGVAPAVLMCGGVGRFERSEADAMALVGVAEGLASEVIHTEDQTANTLENTSFAQWKMAKKSWRSATLVTYNFYLPRAVFVFRALGIDVEGNAPLLVLSPSSILAQFREYVAHINYMFRVRRYLKQNNENYLGLDY